jgi:hypothetical protein
MALSKFSGIYYMTAANLIFTCYTFPLKTMPVDIANVMVIRQAVQAIVLEHTPAIINNTIC